MAKDNKAQKENVKELREEVRMSTSLEGNLGNLANALGGGEMQEAESSFSGSRMENGVLKPMDHHLDPTSLLGSIPEGGGSSSPGYRVGKGSAWGKSLLINNDTKPSAPQQKIASKQSIAETDLGDLTPIIADILSFKYSENRQKEIEKIHAAVKTELTKISARRVVANTEKKVKNAKKFYLTDTGSLRTEFTILGQKYSMLAKGAFRGDEILYPTVEGDDVVGLIMRDAPSGLQNASDEFEITILKGWKE